MNNKVSNPLRRNEEDPVMDEEKKGGSCPVSRGVWGSMLLLKENDRSRRGTGGHAGDGGAVETRNNSGEIGNRFQKWGREARGQ